MPQVRFELANIPSLDLQHNTPWPQTSDWIFYECQRSA